LGTNLSGGVRRLVGFVMTIVWPGPLVILDEPTNDVDPLRRRLLWEQIRRLGDTGAAVIQVTYNVLEAERSVDRLAIIDAGKLVAVGLSCWVYGVTLTPSLMIVPAAGLAAAMATSVGYGLGHLVRNPRVINPLTNLLVFLVLMFSPIVVPIERFPTWFGAIHQVLPFWHMANVLRDGLTSGLVDHIARSHAVLTAWLIAAWGVTAWVISRRG
jgi:energy-coupling factor transporter ATP-binding protein EcfA2